MPLGFPGGVTMVRVFEAKLTGSLVSRPASTALVMLFVSAEVNTSAGAPWVSWATRSEEPAKLNVTDVPGLSFSKRVPSSVNVDLSEAAANTVTSPVMAVDVGEASALVVEAESVCDDEQPTTSAVTLNPVAIPTIDLMRFLLGFRR